MIMLKYVCMFLEKDLTENAEKFLIFISWLEPQWTLISYICVFFFGKWGFVLFSYNKTWGKDQKHVNPNINSDNLQGIEL